MCFVTDRVWHPLHFSIAIFTLAFGIVASLAFDYTFSRVVDPLASDVTVPTNLNSTNQPGEITFQSLAIGCGDGFSSTGYMVSDGTHLSRTTSYRFRSRRAAQRMFDGAKENASVIFDQNPAVDYHGRKKGDRVVFEKEGRVHIVTLFGAEDDELRVVDIAGASLRHVIEFEKQENSLANSVYLNRLN